LATNQNSSPSPAPIALELPSLEHTTSSAELLTAFRAAAAGARVILDYYHRGVEMRSKLNEQAHNLVSDADVHAEQAIAAAILADFPTHTLLGEEELSGNVEADDLWIVDPLDGTNNFAHRIPHFAVSIAYYRLGRAVCGVVVNPVRGDWYWATVGGGAFHNGQRMQVNSQASLNRAMIGCGFYYDRGAMMESTLAAIHAFFKQQIHGIRRFGTAALDLCHVADGLYGVFFEYQLMAWDFAAGRLILEEAGGTITTGLGADLPLAKTCILASNSLLHPAALEIVAAHHPSQGPRDHGAQ
jgi:myo-inositol-1(or 4)-monophosphatase